MRLVFSRAFQTYVFFVHSEAKSAKLRPCSGIGPMARPDTVNTVNTVNTAAIAVAVVIATGIDVIVFDVAVGVAVLADT